MQSTDHQLEVVVHGQVGRGGKGAVDDEEEGSLGFVRMQQIVVECTHAGGAELGSLVVALNDNVLEGESAVAHLGLASVQHIATVDVEHVCLVAFDETQREREDSVLEGSGHL